MKRISAPTINALATQISKNLENRIANSNTTDKVRAAYLKHKATAPTTRLGNLELEASELEAEIKLLQARLAEVKAEIAGEKAGF